MKRCRWGFLAIALVGCSSVTAPDPLLKPSAQTAQIVDPAVTADLVSQLSVASGDRDESVKVLYPLATQLIARNMSQLQFQWTYTGGKAFRIRAKSAALDTSFFVPASACNKNQCSYSPQGSDWLSVTQPASGSTVEIAIYALNGGVHESDAMTLTVAPEDVKGSLYYFSSSLQGVVRLPFGATSPSFFEGVGSTGAAVSTNCVGCHAVSHDGNKFAGVVGGGDGFLTLYDTSTPTPTTILPPDVGVHSNFNSFNADGTRLVANWAGSLFILDTTSGQTLATIPESLIGGRAVMPEWSPDGTHLVFVRIPAGGGLFPDVADPSYKGVILAGDWLIDNAGEICTITIDANNNFGAPQVIVPVTNDGQYHYYPSWSPDSQWIVFDTGSLTGADSPIALASAADGGYGIPAGSVVSYDQATSRLRLVRATGGTPLELARANRGEGYTNAWPKFAPFQQGNGQYVFITFSSKADYGFVVTGRDQPQIWMAGLDLNLAAALTSGTASKNVEPDPSFAPFWLPFQDSTTNNHATIWTQQIQCAKDIDCGAGATCIDNVCEGIVQ